MSDVGTQADRGDSGRAGVFSQILVGVDQPGAADAVALARVLSGPATRITLAHVLPSLPYLPRSPLGEAAGTSDDDRTHASDLLVRAREQLGGDLGARTEMTCLEAVSVGRGLHELAERIGADVIVVGSSRRGLIGRVLLGDDTHAALDGAPSAVAIAPAAYAAASAPPTRIGIGYDGSPDAVHALQTARVLAAEHRARLVAFTAVSVPLTRFGPGELPLTDAIKRLVRDAIARLDALGEVEAHAAYGQAAQELGAFSRGVDLLVIGSRGYGPIGRIVHGSTSRELAGLARCPLIVMPHGPAAERRRSHAGAELAHIGH